MKQLLAMSGHQQLAAMNLNMAEHLAQLVVNLVNDGISPHPEAYALAAAKVATPPVPPAPPVTRNDKENGEDQEFQRVLRWDLKNKTSPKSVSAIYEEYYGEGEYKNCPVEGGLKQLEVKYGTKWRAGCPAYQKAFNRFQLIVKCVDGQIDGGKREKDIVLAEMDKLFEEKNCKTLQQIRDVLEKEGLLPKLKQRAAGRSRPATLA
jgi:Transcriptional activator of glycolytic enzymes